ncbi:hypothetical protein [Magnetospirillum fulvum]|uniref:Uncharacterized protein n=1 Tax=Magnetospirillum fulvum MGU-K5 TaxID=1316936 RepID=S9S8S2_MAGFU|nr:hypothetical protein [Magnetospirillum fulvum]EPY02312.1 Hypothetical protein K678_06562 [Magnetospirillum fulvum MGU-K5]
MHYIRRVTDLETGEVKTISLGEHLPFTEAAAKFGVTRPTLVKVLLQLGLVQKEFDTVARENRYRLHPEAEKKGLGKRLMGPHGPFDVLCPSALEWLEADLKAILAASTFDRATVTALQALDAYDAERLSKLDVEGKVLWLIYHFPDLPVRQMAQGLGVSERLVHRYLTKRRDQLERASKRMAGEVFTPAEPEVEPKAEPEADRQSLAA